MFLFFLIIQLVLTVYLLDSFHTVRLNRMFIPVGRFIKRLRTPFLKRTAIKEASSDSNEKIPPLLQFPDCEEKWDEGEVSWNITDDSVSTVKKHKTLDINPDHRLAFLFV